MVFKGAFVDDEDDVYVGTLSTDGELDFEFFSVTEVSTLAKSITDFQPTIVAIDYRLDEVSTGASAPQTFKGSALAQQLRDAAIEQPTIDFAIVLVSAEDNIRKFYRPDITAHDLFDRVYVKGQLVDQKLSVRSQLISLCEGYSTLREKVEKFDLFELTNAVDDDKDRLEVQELKQKMSEAKAPHHVARIFLNLLIDRNGLLLDSDALCALFGIATSSLSELENAMSEETLAYTGLFSGIAKRWWAHRAEAWAQSIFEDRPTGLTSGARAEILVEKTGGNFEPAISPWTNTTDELISFPCAFCKRGTEISHSVAAYEPTLPRFVTRRRICWDCIQLDNVPATDPAIDIDDGDSEMAEQVKRLERPQPTMNMGK